MPAPRQHLDKEDKAALEKGDALDWTPAQKCQRETDASWTRKHGKSRFGYKLSARVDVKHTLIRKIGTGTASEHDSQHFDAVLDAGNTGSAVYAWNPYTAREDEARGGENPRNVAEITFEERHEGLRVTRGSP